MIHKMDHSVSKRKKQNELQNITTSANENSNLCGDAATERTTGTERDVHV
jgi:hypothetical protein